MPKQAQQAEEALRGMQRRLMQVRQRQAQAGVALEPPEDLLVQIGALGGPEAEAEARRVYAQPWEVVDRATLEARVREVAIAPIAPTLTLSLARVASPNPNPST